MHSKSCLDFAVAAVMPAAYPLHSENQKRIKRQNMSS